MTSFFTYTESAEYCYIFEAVHWIAFGQVPEFIVDEKGRTEARTSPREHEESFTPIVSPSLWLNELELKSFLPDVDPRKYREAISETYGETAAEIERRFSFHLDFQTERTERTPELEEYYRSHKLQTEKRISLAKWLEEVTQPLRPMEERAKAKLFVHLSEGEISASGYFERDEENADFITVDVAEIPKESWNLSEIDWNLASLVVDGQRFIGAHVEFSELLKKFPIPHLEPKILNTHQFGSTAIVSDFSENTSRTGLTQKGRPRGRPLMGGGVVRVAVMNEYLRRKLAGELSDKKEANIAALAEWAQEILAENPSRSAIQRWFVEADTKPNNRLKNTGK